MVWNSGQSPLYKTVEKFNNRPPENDIGKCCDEVHEEKRPEPPRSTPPKFSCPDREKGALSKFGDRDFLLITALIVLLLHEKADMKLIAALAFVLLG
ncbi:MAG: hypothetical protein SPD47_00315 [Oscillospiraceae bacterium]|nr:hypothetical protein [Oscillospiraceae bacterium]